MLQCMKTALVMVNREYHVVFVNDAALSIFETGKSQICQKPFLSFFAPDSFDEDRFENVFEAGEEFSQSELQLCFKDGRCLLVDMQANLALIDGEKMILFEIMHVDKQRKISQETQQYAQQMAARDLIRGLAHEIKNPLGGIRGAAQLLSRQLPNEDQLEFTQMIMDQADRLRALVDRLLGPNTLPHKRLCNLHEVIEKVKRVITADQSIDIDIERDYDPSIPEVYADPDMLEQAILNIVRNACQALSEAKIERPIIGLRTRIERRCVINGKPHSLSALVSIVDNGPGIPKEVRDTLFYPMVSSKANGSGLGLSIAQTLINHHFGKIDVDSFPGYTEFTLYLPIIKQDLADE
ncbi:nitrogen regulation protein NR(II) [Glaciecola sp. 1036]|uniref:nitrogen regulation protein NR(II) n=1 Tax=Alteromonadaceae TaxID=72275 RepID=UPI003D008F80